MYLALKYIRLIFNVLAYEVAAQKLNNSNTLSYVQFNNIEALEYITNRVMSSTNRSNQLFH